MSGLGIQMENGVHGSINARDCPLHVGREADVTWAEMLAISVPSIHRYSLVL